MTDSRKRKSIKDVLKKITIPEFKTPDIRLPGGRRLPDLEFPVRIFMIVLIVAIIAALVVLIRYCSIQNSSAEISETESVQVETITHVDTLSAEEIEELKAKAEAEELAKRKQEIVDSYSNLAIVQVEDAGYLNIRKDPDIYSDIVGKLYDKGVCSILDEKPVVADGISWQKISSGEVVGFVSDRFLIKGDEARKIALEEVKDRAIVKVDTLYLRQQPSTDSQILASLIKGERYEVKDVKDGWIQLDRGYIKEEYADIELCFNEAQKLDMVSMVLNMYDDIGISNVTNYLNIREGAGEDEKIIGKLPSHAAADILGEEGDWYHIQSGPVKGYVSKQYMLTGDLAKAVALEEAELMAIVKTDVLNVRTDPDTDASIWTQIITNERYPVVSQLDGWVEIDLGDTDEEGNNVTAFASTDYVDVRYALNEAIKFSPLEEAAANSSRLRNKVVNYALQFLGNPYVWGGTSLTNGCDCSGFTKSVMANAAGVYLPHYSVDQSKMGSRVTSDSMRPGDLIFYTNKNGTINHVAMYIGNGQVVHAANKRSGIKISSWNYRSPKAIRNVLGD